MPHHSALVRRVCHSRLFRALSAAVLLAPAAACRDVPAALGPDQRAARANADALFDGLAQRFDNVQRAPKFHQARAKLGRYALSPSGIINDTSAWTSNGPDTSRTLTLRGAHAPTGYVFATLASAPLPAATGESRHVIRLKRRGPSEYEWQTAVDHALGTARPGEIAAAVKALVAGGEQAGAVSRVARNAAFPRTSRTLGELFSLDTIRATPAGDGSTSVLVRFRIHPRRIEKTRPNFAKYLEKYVEPARYRFIVRDPRGVVFLDAAGAENVFTISYRSRGGDLLALTGPPISLPDSAQVAVEFSAKFMIFRVGVSRLIGDFITVRGGGTCCSRAGGSGDERGWVVRFRREPSWHFPLAVNNLIRSSLRYPFAGDGITLKVTVRDGVRDGVSGQTTRQTLLSRDLRLAVQESGIVRWLGGLGSSAMNDFAGRAEAEENRYVYEVLTALRADFVAALNGE